MSVESQLLLRATPGLAEKLNSLLDRKSESALEIGFKPASGRGGDLREGVLTIGGQRYTFDVKDLPCIIECQKTFDNESMYKTGDIGQVLHVRTADSRAQMDVETRSPENSFPGTAAAAAAQELSVALERKLSDKFEENSGITPPTRHIRLDRFRYPPVGKKEVEKMVGVLQHMVQQLPQNGGGKKIVTRELVQVEVDESDLSKYESDQTIIVNRTTGKLSVRRRTPARTTPRLSRPSSGRPIAAPSPMPPPARRSPQRTSPRRRTSDRRRTPAGPSPKASPFNAPFVHSPSPLQPTSSPMRPTLDSEPNPFISPSPQAPPHPSPHSKSTPSASPLPRVPPVDPANPSPSPPSVPAVPELSTPHPSLPAVPTGPDPKVMVAMEKRTRCAERALDAKKQAEKIKSAIAKTKNPIMKRRKLKELKDAEKALESAEKELSEATNELESARAAAAEN